MTKEWMGCAPSNFRKGRPSGMQPQAIVIHIVCGSLQSATSHFQDPTSSVSAHYAVGRDGRVLQFVEETDTAFHAGIVVSPTWRLIRAGVNPNLYTIGIEHEGQPDDDWTASQYAASAELISSIAARWSIPLDADHLVLHREIRASKTCPGTGFDRATLLSRLGSQTPVPRSGLFPLSVEVELVGRANLRSTAPSTQAAIDRVCQPGELILVSAFTPEGERVNGNSNWYLTTSGSYLWAGATLSPSPQRESVDEPIAVPPSAASSIVRSSIPRSSPAPKKLQDMLATVGAALEITLDDPDKEAVAAVQDLLVCHGAKSLPGLLSSNRGKYDAKTANAVRQFQTRNAMPVTGNVNAATLRKLISESAADPRCSEAYLTLVLGQPFSGMLRILSVVAQMEGVGRFGALNLNTDKAGLSFGLIQWAQRPGRLPELLKAFRNADRGRYERIFANGQPGVADDLITFVSRANGGVDRNTGVTLDAAFNLVDEPWVSRFRTAAGELSLQTTQIRVALAAFRKSYELIKTYAPDMRSERAIAFFLDVANQFGDGGTRKLYNLIHQPGMAEQDLLEAIADETVRRMPQQFRPGVRARRDGFLETSFLSDREFVES